MIGVPDFGLIVLRDFLYYILHTACSEAQCQGTKANRGYRLGVSVLLWPATSLDTDNIVLLGKSRFTRLPKSCITL